MKRKVYTLCGSVKFMDKILEIHENLELEGYVVIGIVQHIRQKPYTPEEEELLDVIHRIKIDMADAIYVVNVNGYIGSSTQGEIEYAKKTGKEITYYVNPD